MKDSLRVAIKTNKGANVEYRVIKDNGEELWILGKGKIHLDEDGLPVRMSGTAHDITETKRANEQKNSYVLAMEDMLFSLSA